MQARQRSGHLHDALYIAAKSPIPGFAKTRLGAAIGHDQATMLYRAFLHDISARFAHAPFAVGWFVTPDDAWTQLAPLVQPNGAIPRVLVQGPGDWTERQRLLFRTAAERGEDKIVLIGSDSPHLTVDQIEEAFSLLNNHEVVMGPVYDGGYYLIGMRGWHDVLSGVRMSTSSVFDEVVAAACAAGISVGFVPSTFDVDELDDLRHLDAVAASRADLGTTKAALHELGLLISGAPPVV